MTRFFIREQRNPNRGETKWTEKRVIYGAPATLGGDGEAERD